MNRRAFLQGTLIGVSAVASTALVKLATPEETRSLVEGQSALIGQPLPMTNPFNAVGVMVYVEDDNGKMLPIGFLTSVHVTTPVHEHVTWEGEIMMTSGLKSGNARFEGSWR